MRLAANQFTFTLPAWIDDLLADVPEVIPTREERMQLVHRLADRNWREGNGGPFAALVAESATGRIVSVGVNVVLTSGVSSGHAEVTALGTAQKAVGSWDLGGAGLPEHELVVNWRPCAQCYGATMWSGVRTMVVAGSGPELEEITTFDEGPVRDDWAVLPIVQRFLHRDLGAWPDATVVESREQDQYGRDLPDEPERPPRRHWSPTASRAILRRRSV